MESYSCLRFFVDDIIATANEHEAIIAVLGKYAGVSIDRLIDVKKQSSVTFYTQEAFILPALNPVSDLRYLRQRGILCSTLEHEFFKEKVFEIKNFNYVNLAFPYYDCEENIVGLEISNFNFKRFLPGSNKKESIWHSNIPDKIESVFLFESVIDALSYYQIKSELNPLSLFVSFGGNISGQQLVTVQRIVEQYQLVKSVDTFCCTDNDAMGEQHFEKIKIFFTSNNYLVKRECPKLKDFNEDVMNCRKINKKGVF